MALLNQLSVLPFISTRRKNGHTYNDIARELRALFPATDRGLSARSIKRFCRANDLHATSRVDDQTLDVLIAFGIGMVSVCLLL